MNLDRVTAPASAYAFRSWRFLAAGLPGGRIRAFGGAADQIGSILVLNLDRQPKRFRRVMRELGRFRTSEGVPLTSITNRLAAVDARDGRAVAATADVDPMYSVGDQLFVQPDARLAACFAPNEPVRMTRQEVAVAHSHIEAWKAVSGGRDDYVLVLEDDVWFKPGARAAIDRGWRAAYSRCFATGGPRFLYVSYSDAGGTVERRDACEGVFRPERGLWFLSGYVISRKGAAALLCAMPVAGPVDLWMNYRLGELGALALNSPALAQRADERSDNLYSVLPYLARAGIVDAAHGAKPPDPTSAGPVLAWSGRTEQESLAMALSMLGLRVRVFNGDEDPMHNEDLQEVWTSFDALVDAPITPTALADAASSGRCVMVFESGAELPTGLRLAPRRSAFLPPGGSWELLCSVLGLDIPAEAFPSGAPSSLGLFRDVQPVRRRESAARSHQVVSPMDSSPWVLPPSRVWLPELCLNRAVPAAAPVIEDSLTSPSTRFPGLVETFPGNLASFALERLRHDTEGAHLTIDIDDDGQRPYRSAAFASVRSFRHGRFEAEIRAARGSGLVTGFFLHRASPRQEIDIEFLGDNPSQMLTNVYFNPGDDGTAMEFGYRGSPCRIELGFDATADFHHYAIDWWPDRLIWQVDGNVVHERLSWDPTPIPHLEMRLYANLWAPRSEDLAGRIDKRSLPAVASFRRLSIGH
jgi:GR25 family glycosyltransferase involved in LPS biosynthesis